MFASYYYYRSSKSSQKSKSGTRVAKLLQAHREGIKPGTSCKKLYGGLCHTLMENLDKAEQEDRARIHASFENVGEEEVKPPPQEKIDKKILGHKVLATHEDFWDMKTKTSKLNMDKKIMMKKKKYRSKY